MTTEPPKLSATPEGEVLRLLGVLDERTESMSERLDTTQQLCRQHGERIAVLETRVDTLEGRDPDDGAARPRRPSEDIRAATEEATGKIRLSAIAETQRAADELAERQHQAAMRELELRHAASLKEMELKDAQRKQWLRIAVAVIALLGGGGGVTLWRAVSNGDEREAKVEQALKRIEKRAAPPAHPDAGVRP